MAQEESRWVRLARAADELNEVLGLKPQIDTENGTEEEIEEKLRIAVEALVTPEDEFTEETAETLDSLFEEDEEVEDAEVVSEMDTDDTESEETEDEEPEDEDEEQPEVSETDTDEEPEGVVMEEAEEVTGNEKLQILYNEAKEMRSRKDLYHFVQKHPILKPVSNELPELKTGRALQKRILEFLKEQRQENVAETKTEATSSKATEAKEQKATPAKPVKKPAAKKGTKKRPGVIKTIVRIIEEAGDKGVTKDEILEQLSQEFPDRKPDSMKTTINVQVPNRISKERFEIENIDGRYRKK